MKMATQIVCNYNKFGFCKFKQNCMKQHIEHLCEDSSCDVLTCTLLHPKECKFYRDFNRCKFSDWCRFAHVHKEDQNEKVLGKLIEIEKNNLEKDKQISILKLENERVSNKLSEMEKNNFEKKNNLKTQFGQ